MLNIKREPTRHALMVTALMVAGGCHSSPSSTTPVLYSYSPDGGGGPTPHNKSNPFSKALATAW